MHLTIDGYGGDPKRLSSETVVRDLLDRFPGEIQMTKISEPYVLKYEGIKPEDWGVTGFVIIAESHIAVHTFPEYGYVWVDIFSCKEFEAPSALNRIVDTFGLSSVTERMLERGLEYPHSIEQSRPIARGERLAVAGSVGSRSA